ncbi:D-2-hydroxyacid dehydrogenase family protein [Roseomonas sp. SSH11]|uniref:D-2-hydroxyacid dehydrogenase family protein n=1 Tax=Pararoseomonas baculiformis TaxID=2820812 RepID=A0ABS4ABW0_9PROT|nr:D-2-hydroxyacid dehydrogenase family protein [Pararoseomonas baculiformis]MBP0444498.1 D-2-hydroxyacid dehydrogenase family protein [Pararoseomonas baculiformis]
MSSLSRIAVLDDYQGVALSLADWGSLGVPVDVFRDTIKDEDALAARLAPYDAIVLMRERTPFPRSLIERLPNLKLLVTTAGRNLSVDSGALKERGITFCGTGGGVSQTAELTWGLILALVRDIPAQDRSLREGRWQTALGEGLEGQTLGIIGLGKQGQRVAKVALAFGMRVIAWSQNLTAETAAAHGAERVEKEALLREADVVTLHLVLSARSRHTIGAAELSLMKPGAFLVNTSRGPLVDSQALESALREGRIAGAGLDVFDEEPLAAGASIAALPNTVLTPHLGYVTRGNLATFYQGAVEDIAAYLAGAPIRVI